MFAPDHSRDENNSGGKQTVSGDEIFAGRLMGELAMLEETALERNERGGAELNRRDFITSQRLLALWRRFVKTASKVHNETGAINHKD